MLDSQTATALLNVRLALGVTRTAHAEDQIVVGHDRFDAIGQGVQHLFEKGRSLPTRSLGPDAGHCLAAEIVHHRVSVFP